MSPVYYYHSPIYKYLLSIVDMHCCELNSELRAKLEQQIKRTLLSISEGNIKPVTPRGILQRRTESRDRFKKV